MFEVNGTMVSSAARAGSRMPCETPSPSGSGLFARLVNPQLVQGNISLRRQTGITGRSGADRAGQADCHRPWKTRDNVHELLAMFLANLGRCSASVMLPGPCPSLSPNNSPEHGATFVPVRTFSRSSFVTNSSLMNGETARW